jgi:catechol 2,3-dioxygenase-like lactoylglutathione lyase family enzyme
MVASSLEAAMTKTPTLDHIAFLTPDLDGLVERLTGAFGMQVEVRTPQFAVLADPGSGLTLELGQSGDGAVHFRHLGFRADDVDADHQLLAEAGMEVVHAPHRRDFARMYTSFLRQPGGLEVQLVKYDQA